jgi:putative aldouronate transport system substrate-binding protein
MLFNFGVEGLSYKMDNGYPKYTDAAVKDPKLPLAQSMAQFFRSNYNGPFVQDKRYFEQYAALPEQQNSVKVWSEPVNDMLMPPVTPTQDESKKFASIMNDVNTLRDEMVVKVITGGKPVAEWDQVVAQMKQMGIEDALKIQQAALDRYNKR